MTRPGTCDAVSGKESGQTTMDYFAVSDNREEKAGKIEAVLCNFLGTNHIEGKKILDLGCGSGHIAAFFSRTNEVVAADVVDQMTIPDRGALSFRRINNSAVLPFKDGEFDIVILNHVIYCMKDQVGGLKEIRRILKENGVCYFASANRYFPVEGFTKMPLLHYLPGPVFRTLYKKMIKTDVDLFPLGYRGILKTITRAGFAYQEYTSNIIRHPEKYHSEYAMPRFLPVLKCLSPTVVFVLGKRGAA